jgi:hypothetical protein
VDPPSHRQDALRTFIFQVARDERFGVKLKTAVAERGGEE